MECISFIHSQHSLHCTFLLRRDWVNNPHRASWISALLVDYYGHKQHKFMGAVRIPHWIVFCSFTPKFCQKGQPEREERERAEEWEIQRNGKTERAGCDLNPRLGKKESHALWNMHTHNTHIWSIQFLLPISEDKYDGCKLHTVNLVFHIVYMRWVSTPVNYSADYSELPFINEGCGCLVGLIHESSPPPRVISRLFGFEMWGRLWHFHFECIITLLR